MLIDSVRNLPERNLWIMRWVKWISTRRLDKRSAVSAHVEHSIAWLLRPLAAGFHAESMHGLVEKAHLNPMMCLLITRFAALLQDGVVRNHEAIGRRAPTDPNR